MDLCQGQSLESVFLDLEFYKETWGFLENPIFYNHI